MSSLKGKGSYRFLSFLFVFCLLFTQPADCRYFKNHNLSVTERLDKGEVVVGLKEIGKKKFVTGRVWIPYSLDKVWPIMVNPYEFKSNISPGMRDLEVITDTANMSVLKVTAKYPIPLPIPPISYTVQSNYSHSPDNSLVEFKRVGGALKDFHGFWRAKSICHGTKTEIFYSMYIEPGFFVPQWIIRRGVSGQLPDTLNSLRKRIKSIYSTHSPREKQSITATAQLPKVTNQL